MSQMLQHYIIEHGKMPKTNREMEDLFKINDQWAINNYQWSLTTSGRPHLLGANLKNLVPVVTGTLHVVIETLVR